MPPEPRNLARSRTGATIHRADCKYASHKFGAVPWLWADRVTDDELLATKIKMGYFVCRVCKPLFRREGIRHADS